MGAAAVIANHHISIDGTLEQDSSMVNDLSDFSYRARTKGCLEVSVLYAYDIEAMEPVCAEVFPGDSIDASPYAAFIQDNDIRKGIIVFDKGFPPSQIKKELEERPGLHFLTPIKRDDVRISYNDTLSFESVLSGVDDHVLYLRNVSFKESITFMLHKSFQEHRRRGSLLPGPQGEAEAFPARRIWKEAQRLWNDRVRIRPGP